MHQQSHLVLIYLKLIKGSILIGNMVLLSGSKVILCQKIYILRPIQLDLSIA
jgi:hypothetical protein